MTRLINKMARDIYKYLHIRMASELLFNVFLISVLSPFEKTVEGHSQAFIQTDKELHYLVDTLQFQEGLSAGLPDISFVDVKEDLFHSYKSPIAFEPPMLDFGEQSVGISHMERVMVFNPSHEHSLTFTSISGSTVHFHCSFFQDKIVQPGGNTTFDVVFLARQVGNVENTLYIHTSLGSFQYQVFGVGTPNPYRLRPFLGARLPINSSFTPIISMHNPHSFPLQVVEMYSSGGDLHLELPSGQKEAAHGLWEIPPYETKPVMRANFVGRVESNHTAYIRIRTNKQKDDYLILPVEVEVLSVPGLYSTTEILDFGILRVDEHSKSLDLNLLNSGLKPVHIVNVTVSHLNEAVKIDFTPIRVPPDTLKPTTVAKIIFSASKALDPKHWKGKILVKTKINLYKLSIPYQATVLFGSFSYDEKSTQFFVKEPLERISRKFYLTNKFNFSVVIYSVTLGLEAESFFKIENFSKPLIILPNEKIIPFLITFEANSSDLHLQSSLRLHTNISDFTIPLVCYNGKLKFVAQSSGASLDFGTLGMGDSAHMTFTLRNDNPVDIVISSLKSTLDKSVIELLGVEKGNGTSLTKINNITKADQVILKPFHFGVFVLNIVAPAHEGFFSKEISITTQFETFTFPVRLRTAEGSLSLIPEILVFESSFPGRISSESIQIRSSFSHPMDVKTIRSYQDQFTLELLKHKLEPKSKTVIGKVHFDPLPHCKPDCYVGLPIHLAAGHRWLSSLTLPPDVGENDAFLYKLLRRRWEDLVQAGQNFLNATFQLDTSEVRGFLLRAQAHLHWPHLISKKNLKFSLTQLGNTSISDLILDNPSTLPILVQILFLSLYPAPYALMDLLNISSSHEDKDDSFSLDENLKPESFFVTYRKAFENYFGIKSHKNALTFILRPESKVTLKVAFSPQDESSHSAILLVRNNLTILETVTVHGRGGGGILRFGNRKSGSSTPLLFEMTEKHLKDCEKSWSGRTLFPNFTVKRAFTARNTGELPLYIQGFSINGSPCEGYGFKVLNCDGFELQPNASKKIEIAFTPDFTTSRVQRTLLIHSNLGLSDNFSIVATLPQGLMAFCAEALPRPPWERLLYSISIICMSAIFVITIIAAYCDASRLVQWYYDDFRKSKVFNLQPIHLSTKEDLEPLFDKKLDSKDFANPPSPKFVYQRQTSKDGDLKTSNIMNGFSSDILTVNKEISFCKNAKRNNKKQSFDLGQNELDVSNGNFEKNHNNRSKTSARSLKESSYQRKSKGKLTKKELCKQKNLRSISDIEETSSSTTESSSLDSDEKEIKATYVHNENSLANKKGRTKAAKQPQKLKMNTFNEKRSSSLELPYRIEPITPLSADCNPKQSDSWVDPDESIWDMPKSVSHDDDFSEFSIQSQKFAQKHSYSSIVSRTAERSSPGTIGQKSKLCFKPVMCEQQNDILSPIHGTPKTPAPPGFIDDGNNIDNLCPLQGFAFGSYTKPSEHYDSGEDWPGFNLTLPSSNSWWDETAEPSVEVSSIWGQSASSLWPPVSNSSGAEDSSVSGNEIQREFDPFNSLSSIWSPVNTPGGATWSFQSQDDQKSISKLG